MTFILQYWRQLLGGVAVLAVVLWINRLGYESGYNASESKWRPAFDAANKALAEANARTQQQEAASRALTQKAEAEHAQTLASLQSRADAADGRIRVLMRDAAQRANRGPVPAATGTPAEPDAASPVTERSERAGSDLVALARRCEADAAALTSLQAWIRNQQALR